MKMILNDVLVLNDVVKSLIDNKTLSINMVLKFRLLGIAKSLEQHVSNYNIIRESKIMEYGTEAVDAEGNKLGVYEIKTENTDAVEKFKRDLGEFLLTEVDVNIQKLKVQEVFDAGVPADYLVHLYGIIEE